MQNKVKYPTQTLRFSFTLDYDQKGISSVTTEIEIRVLTERNYKLISYLRQVQWNVDSSRGQSARHFSAQFKRAVELRKKYLYLYRLQFSLTVAK